jgi:hypothetical protein
VPASARARAAEQTIGDNTIGNEGSTLRRKEAAHRSEGIPNNVNVVVMRRAHRTAQVFTQSIDVGEGVRHLENVEVKAGDDTLG